MPLQRGTTRFSETHLKAKNRVVSHEPEAQLARLEYLLANGTKDGLVASPIDWPGPNVARTFLHGEPLVGTWFDQTKEWAARRRGENFEKFDYTTRYQIELLPLPTYRYLSTDDYRATVAGLVAKVEQGARAARRERSVLGANAILAQDPTEQPRKAKRSPAPMLLFSKSKEVANRNEGRLPALRLPVPRSLQEATLPLRRSLPPRPKTRLSLR